MNRIEIIINKLLNYSLILMLAVTVILVFFNVILRYVFNSGISTTEELSRFLFVWITFIGSILAFKENSHVNIDVFLKKFSTKYRHYIFVFINLIMIICCILIIIGSYQQMTINFNNLSPISGIPTGINFFASLIMGLSIGLILIIRIIKSFHSSRLDKGENR